MKRKFLLILLTVLVVFSMFSVVAMASDTPTSGSCGSNGDNATWSFDESTGTLTISGSGDTEHFVYQNQYKRPWYNIKLDIKSVVIEEGITKIGGYSFADCSNLQNIKLSDSLKFIESDAFRNCNSLKSIKLPDSMSAILTHSFRYCTGLESIIIPKSITMIGIDFVAGCKNLSDIYYGGSESDWLNINIMSQSDNYLKNATIHYNSTGPIQEFNQSFAETVTQTYGDAAFTKAAILTQGDGTITYDSSNNNVATVDNNGLVTIKGAGKTTITATAAATENYESATISYELTVTKQQIGKPLADTTEFTYTGNEQTYRLADSANYTVTDNKRTNAGSQTVMVALNDKDNMEWVGGGSDDLEFTFTIGKAYQTFNQDFVETVTKTEGDIPFTKAAELTAGDGEITYSSSDTGVATVDNSGQVTIVGAGSTTITAAAAETANYLPRTIGYELEVEAQAPPTKEVQEFNQDFAIAVNKEYGDNFTKTAELIKGDGAITYTSSNEAVATVNNDGEVTILSVGKTTITATTAETDKFAQQRIRYTLTVEPKKIDKPVADTTQFVYNGKEQTYNITGSNYYTVNNTKRTNAGTKTVTAVLKDKRNTAWADGSTDDLNYEFTISKAKIAVSVKNKNIEAGAKVPDLSNPVMNTDYTVTGLADGDTLSSITLQYQKNGAEVAVDTSKAGSYDIVALVTISDANDNYEDTIQYTKGTLTINGTGGSSSGGGGGGGSVTKPTDDDNKPPVVDDKKPVDKFTDVQDHWAKDAINYVLEKGLMNGISDTLFGPEFNTSRGMIVTILYRLEGEPTVTRGSGFQDVGDGQYYSKAVAWAADNGVVTGYTSTEFVPDGNITREQMAAILYRYANYKGINTTSTGSLGNFIDGRYVSNYAQGAMSWAVDMKLIQGDSGKLNPTAGATRAEVATILMRYCENILK